METLVDKWNELMANPYAVGIIRGAGLLCLVMVAVYVIGLVRSMALGGFQVTSDEDFDVIREIHNRGMIADEEFQRAKKVVTDNATPEDLLKANKTEDAGDRK